jgi:hypothetical protein
MDESSSMSILFSAGEASPELKMYFPFLLAGVCSLFVPLCIWSLAKFFGSVQPGRKEEKALPPHPFERTSERNEQAALFKMGRRFNSRFFVGSIITHLLVSFALIMVPLVYRLGFPMPEKGDRLRTLSLIVILAALILLSLLYGADKGDLMMLKTFREDEPEKGTEASTT